MTRAYSPKLVAYVSLAAVGLVASVALRLQELVVVAAPFALLPAVSLLLAREPRIDVAVDLERERALEGDDVDAHVALDADRGAARLELLLELPRGIGLSQGADPAAVWLRDDVRRTVDVGLHCTRWGGYAVGRVFLRARDQFDFVAWEWTADCRSPLKVYPREELIRDLLRPLETQVFSGNHVARQRGEGIEFADLRLFVPGDRVRHVNWRATARRNELWVNQQQAERNADVLIFLDTFAEATREGESTLDLALRAAASVTARYLQQKDRVGFVTFGGMLNWLLPTTGAAQLYRLVDAMIDTQIVFNYAWRDIDVLPRRTLPPKAMVIALTPLLDDRAVGALLDLRARGFDLVVIEISPEPFLEPPRGEIPTLARRIWELRREALRARFQEAGVPLAVWDQERSFAQGLEEVTTFRRRARVVVA
jgi:uncharacterized protein (DUF58 family)